MMKRNFGMWIFLATEALIFGTLILLYQVFYYRYHSDFKMASKDLHLYFGTANTFFLLTSSWFVARAHEKRNRKHILAAMILGLIFLGVKGHEYMSLTHEGKFPLQFFHIQKSHQLFLTFYGYLTFLHAVHVLIGIGCLAFVFVTYGKNQMSERVEENVGLYWHFVDVVWVFLYPLFYLAGNS